LIKLTDRRQRQGVGRIDIAHVVAPTDVNVSRRRFRTEKASRSKQPYPSDFSDGHDCNQHHIRLRP
jgi:hypothetical protein